MHRVVANQVSLGSLGVDSVAGSGAPPPGYTSQRDTSSSIAGINDDDDELEEEGLFKHPPPPPPPSMESPYRDPLLPILPSPYSIEDLRRRSHHEQESLNQNPRPPLPPSCTTTQYTHTHTPHSQCTPVRSSSYYPPQQQQQQQQPLQRDAARSNTCDALQFYSPPQVLSTDNLVFGASTNEQSRPSSQYYRCSTDEHWQPPVVQADNQQTTSPYTDYSRSSSSYHHHRQSTYPPPLRILTYTSTDEGDYGYKEYGNTEEDEGNRSSLINDQSMMMMMNSTATILSPQEEEPSGYQSSHDLARLRRRHPSLPNTPTRQATTSDDHDAIIIATRTATKKNPTAKSSAKAHLLLTPPPPQPTNHVHLSRKCNPSMPPTSKSRGWRRKTAAAQPNTQIPPPRLSSSSSSSAITGTFIINPELYIPPSLLNAMEDPVFFRFFKPSSSDTAEHVVGGETRKRKGSSRRRTNLRLEVENGGIDVDIRLVPTTNVGKEAVPVTGNRHHRDRRGQQQQQQDPFCDTPPPIQEAQTSASTSTTAFSGGPGPPPPPPPHTTDMSSFEKRLLQQSQQQSSSSTTTHPRRSTSMHVREGNTVQLPPPPGTTTSSRKGPQVTQGTTAAAAASRQDKKKKQQQQQQQPSRPTTIDLRIKQAGGGLNIIQKKNQDSSVKINGPVIAFPLIARIHAPNPRPPFHLFASTIDVPNPIQTTIPNPSSTTSPPKEQQFQVLNNNTRNQSRISISNPPVAPTPTTTFIRNSQIYSEPTTPTPTPTSIIVNQPSPLPGRRTRRSLSKHRPRRVSVASSSYGGGGGGGGTPTGGVSSSHTPSSSLTHPSQLHLPSSSSAPSSSASTSTSTSPLYLHLPRTFRGPLTIHISSGHIGDRLRLSEGLEREVALIRESEFSRGYFVGGLGWDVDGDNNVGVDRKRSKRRGKDATKGEEGMGGSRGNDVVNTGATGGGINNRDHIEKTKKTQQLGNNNSNPNKKNMIVDDSELSSSSSVPSSSFIPSSSSSSSSSSSVSTTTYPAWKGTGWYGDRIEILVGSGDVYLQFEDEDEEGNDPFYRARSLMDLKKKKKKKEVGFWKRFFLSRFFLL